jgi:hypothetical protein
VTPIREPSQKFPLRPHPHLYEINTWAWLESLSTRLGRTIKLEDVPDGEWDQFARCGFDVVWLMGIWQRSAESRRLALADPLNRPAFDLALPGWKPEDIVGSPYAVANYVPDPRIGTWHSLDAVRRKLHGLGLALFLDFVGNHTALDHPWVHQHPEYYIQGMPSDFQKDPPSFHRIDLPGGTRFIALGRDPYFPPWRDTAQLNHFEPRMRAAQIADLRAIAAHCDGVRCDMAMLHLSDIFQKTWGHLLGGAKPLPREFWADAHAAVPDLILLAEAYWSTEQRLLDLGFSFCYDKGLYDAERDLRIQEIHDRLAAPVDYQGRLARFLENHDERRCVSVFGKQQLTSAVRLFGTIPGMRFYHQREFDGCSTFLPITLRVGAPESPDPWIASLFDQILSITKQDAFHSGTWNVLSALPESDASSSNLAVYEWRYAATWKLIVVNLAGEPSQGRIHFGNRLLPAQQYIFHDELDGVRYPRGGDELRRLGLFVRRDGFAAHLFDVSPAKP